MLGFQGWQGWAVGVLLTAGGVFAGVLSLLVAFQEKILYVPVLPGGEKKYPYLPDAFGIEYQDVWLTAADGVKLHAWLLWHPEGKKDRTTILFLQENAGNIAHRLHSSSIMMERLRCNMLLLSYRGYGSSEGSPTELGLRLDAQAALDFLLSHPDVKSTKVVAFGRSLGGAVAARLAHSNADKIAALVLENTFTSVLDMASVMFPMLGWAVGSDGYKPLNILVRSQWKTIQIIDKIAVPILFISAANDELVPSGQMRRLLAKAQENRLVQRSFVEFTRGGHMDVWLKGGERYWKILDTFINQHT